MLITYVPGAQHLNCLPPWLGGRGGGRQGQAAPHPTLGAGVSWD